MWGIQPLRLEVSRTLRGRVKNRNVGRSEVGSPGWYVKNIHKKFGDNLVLNNVSFNFQRGKTNLIIGESGSGKTTLLKILIGLYPFDKGSISYDGRIFNEMKLKEKRLIRQEIGMLFQGGALFDYMTVEENIKFPLTMFTNQTEEEKIVRVTN